MKQLSSALFPHSPRPIRGVQFGEGNFLRAFVDYMIDIANEKKITDIGIAVVKPIPMGSLQAFDAQDNLYTVVLRGRHNGEVWNKHRVVSSIEKTVDPYSDFQDYINLANLDTLEFVFSNTTEAGITVNKNDKFNDKPASGFPGKLTQFLYQRFYHFNVDTTKGLIIIPCELIEHNGKALKKAVKEYISLWNLEDNFADWVENSNIFCGTLVDRIVTGYPANAEEIFKTLGYKDNLLSVAEPFGLWVIESDKDISERFPLDKAGQPVLFTSDQTPYRERKVRILNGGHTSMVLAAFLAGENIVRDCMEDKTIRKFLENILNLEIIPTLKLPKKELEDFSASVIERFENPFIDHSLLDISLNSVSKWKARVMPSMLDYYNSNRSIPVYIAFSLAALIAFYNSNNLKEGYLLGNRGEEHYKIIDSQNVLEFFAENSSLPSKDLVEKTLSNKDFWGQDLTEISGLADIVTQHLDSIRTSGARSAINEIVITH